VGRLRALVAKLRRDARGEFDSFQLLDGTYYRYDRVEAQEEIFQYGCDVQLGDADKWPQPPLIFRKMSRARDVALVLERFKPEDPERAFVNPAALFDTDALVNERRLVPILHEAPEDLSSQASEERPPP
jgi:hypothetical protein